MFNSISGKNESLLNEICEDIRAKTLNSKNHRKEMVEAIMAKHKYSHFRYWFTDEDVPAAGAVGTLIEMSGKFRVNYRCAYGKWNYAPCIEIAIP